MRRALLLLAAATLAACALFRNDVSLQGRALHQAALVVDTHDDTTQRMLAPGYALGARHADGSVDLPRLKEGGLDALFFSIYLPGTITGAEAARKAQEQIDAVLREVRANPDGIALATTVAEIEAAQQAGKVAALLGMEGGHMIANDLATLRRFFAQGVRYLTLTHNVNTEWADSAADKAKHGGLSRFGRKVVQEMNRLGMIVDVSHVSDETFHDVLEASTAPMIASHSSVRALCDAPRNMSDAMIRGLAAKGGVIHINFHVGFLSQAFRDASNADDQRLSKAIGAEAERRCAGVTACEILEADRVMREYVAAGKLPRVSFPAIVEHIDHVVKLVGARHVGLGSDFDGAWMPYGMEDASMLPRLTDALLKKGYSEADIRDILGGNTLRVMREVEAVAARS